MLSSHDRKSITDYIKWPIGLNGTHSCMQVAWQEERTCCIGCRMMTEPRLLDFRWPAAGPAAVPATLSKGVLDGRCPLSGCLVIHELAMKLNINACDPHDRHSGLYLHVWFPFDQQDADAGAICFRHTPQQSRLCMYLLKRHMSFATMNFKPTKSSTLQDQMRINCSFTRSGIRCPCGHACV